MAGEDEAYQAAIEGDAAELGRLLADDPSLVAARFGEERAPLLYWAALYGYSGRTTSHRDVVELLIASGAEVDLFAAAYLDRPERAAELLQADPSLVRATTAAGQTALHLAGERGSVEVARLLLAHGADLNARDAFGLTPLECAAHPGPWKCAASEDIVRLLREHGATVDVFQAAAMGDRAAVAALLAQDSALVGARDATGATPLYHAARNLHLDTAKLLLRHGADPNAARADGQTPLSAARTHAWDAGGTDVVRLLESALP